jgi:hypothetical protein
VLHRLDRLTQDEALIAVAQTLGVVHGLVNNTKMVMEGRKCFDLSQTLYSLLLLLDGKASTSGIRETLGMSRTNLIIICAHFGL